MRKGLLKPAAAGLSLALLTACASVVAPLLKPDVSTEVAEVKAGDYSLDRTHAAVLFRINHLGYSTYIGRFEMFDASLTGDANDPASSSVEAVIDMTSLDIANDEFADELMGPDWFDTAAFPQAVFRSATVALTGDTTATVSGDLTLHGVTAPVALDATFNGAAFDRLRGADVIGFSATGRIDRTQFGVSKYSGLIADEVEIEIQAEFIRQADAR
ncbi:YceI family protein [Hyphomonas sp.]|uniref:YceI family protein n=1 Tax=Hyphomonas sp. TaxID=87 RepID=UPI0032EBE9B1